MKKFVAMLMAMLMLLACGAMAETAVEAKSEGVMTYAEYAAAEIIFIFLSSSRNKQSRTYGSISIL